MAWAESEREKLKDAWANGNFTAAFDIEMMAKNAGATGACSALKGLIEIEFDDLYGEDK